MTAHYFRCGHTEYTHGGVRYVINDDLDCPYCQGLKEEDAEMAHTDDTAESLMDRPLREYEQRELKRLEEKAQKQMCGVPDFRKPPICYCHLSKGHYGPHQGRYPTKDGLTGSLNVWEEHS